MVDLHGTASSQLAGNIESTLTTRYWDIDVISGTPGTTDVTLQIENSDEASDPSTLGMLRFDGTDWLELTLVGASGSGPFTVTGQTSSFSEFSIYSTDMDANPLPVELVDFKGRAEAGDIRLTWTTLSEVNSDYFQIERSGDGKIFSPVGSVGAHGNSNQRHNYAFVDMNAGSNVYYYRLRMVDFDEFYEYSETIQIIPNLSDVRVKVYPNPAIDFIQIDGIGTGYLKKLVFYDLNGKMYKSIISFDGSMIPVSDLPRGHYLIRLQLIDGSVFEGKLVRE